MRYQGVEVGTVQSLSLSKDLRTIMVKVSIRNELADSCAKAPSFGW